MSKIDIISGFLGAGKTTLIKKLIAEAYQNEKIVLIENDRDISPVNRNLTNRFKLGLKWVKKEFE